MQAVALFHEMLLKEIHPDVMVFNAVMNVGESGELPKRHAKNKPMVFLGISLIIAYCLGW